MFKTWKRAYAKAYHDVAGAGCATWTKAEMAMAVTQLARPFKGTATEELHDFIDWIVTNWGVLLIEQFRWMKRDKPPELPSLRFVLAFKDKFFDAYGRRAIDKALAALSGYERDIREGMLKEGLTHEQAMFKLAELRARQDLREEIEKGKADAAKQRRIAAVDRAALVVERRAMERRMAEAMRKGEKHQPSKYVLPGGAREISDEELAASVQLVAKMLEVDPNEG